MIFGRNFHLDRVEKQTSRTEGTTMIDWAEPSRTPKHSEQDVIVRTSVSKKPGVKQIAFSFVEGLSELLTSNGRLCVGFDRENLRIYFKEPTSTMYGYKVCNMTTSTRRRVQFTLPNGWPDAFMCGAYDLEGGKDAAYIDLKKKIG